MKDYLSVREWNHITFSFCKITILKNKAILWSGWRFKIWVKPLPQTDISFSGLDQVTHRSLYHPYKTPLNPHIHVKKYEYQLPWDTDQWKAHVYQLSRKEVSEALPCTDRHTAELKNSREIKLKLRGFHVQAPTGYSQLRVKPHSSQLLSVRFQTSWIQTLSLLRRNEEAAARHMYICLRLFWNSVFTQGHYHYFQLQLLHM